MKIYIIFFVFCLLCFKTSNLSAEQLSVNSILATVDGEAITLMDVLAETKMNEEKVRSIYAGKLPPAEEIEKLRNEALQVLIEEKLILNEFKRRSYKVPPKLLERMLDSLAVEFANGDRNRLFELSEQNGISAQKLRKKAEDRAAIELMLNEYSSRYIDVSPKEIQERIDLMKKTINKSPMVELFAIFISKNKEEEKKNEIIEKISKDPAKNNKNIFMTLAKLYSENPSAAQGGNLGWLEKDKLRSEFFDALKNMKQGESSPAIHTPEGVYFIYFAGEQIQAEENVVYDEIREKILSEKKAAARKVFADKLRQNAIIKYFY